MGIYGNYAKSLIEKQNKESVTVQLEIEVDHETFEELLNSSKILQEDTQAKLTLKDGSKVVEIMVRDEVTVTKAGGCKHIKSPGVKVVGPAKLINKSGEIDIKIPQFKATGKRPYQGAKIPGEVNGEAKIDNNNKYSDVQYDKLPAELKLALDFVNQFQKELSLLYKHTNNERNQTKLLRQIISRCEYVTSFDCLDKNQEEELHKKLGI